MRGFLLSAAASAALLASVLPASSAHAYGVARHMVRQQARIAGGLRSGQLTRGEARGLEGRELAIHRQAAVDRAANGGHLTQTEKYTLGHRQQAVSQSIYTDKHNDTVQPPR